MPTPVSGATFTLPSNAAALGFLRDKIAQLPLGGPPSQQLCLRYLLEALFAATSPRTLDELWQAVAFRISFMILPEDKRAQWQQVRSAAEAEFTKLVNFVA